MISEELQLKLQAWLDGELPPNEAAEMQALAARDPDARELVEELRHTAAALSGNETEARLPETREFYWSKIQREINRQEAANADHPAASRPSVSWFAWLRGHFISVGATAVLACILGIFAFSSRAPDGLGGEVELASDDMGSYTYRDQDEQLTMVWLYDKHADDSQLPESPSADKVPPQ
jgi:anti-sigma factor RsiW